MFFMQSAHRNTHPIRVRSIDTQSMEDAMQLDLVDYIADAIGDTEMQSCFSDPSVTDRCVHFEHTPLSGFQPASAPCVQNEHSIVAAPVMSSHRLLLCLATLGWSERELGRRAGRHQTTIRRWIDGRSVVDRDVAEWLAALADFHAAHPAPRAVSEIGSRSGSLIPAL
jgi:hypothetical protein